MPALSLEELLPLARFLKIVRFDNVAIYEITRESISRAFDAGSTEKSVTELLEKYSLYSLPQSLLVNIQDWAASYGSASLYYGFVLRVDEKNTLLVENNPALKNHILEIHREKVCRLYIHNVHASSYKICNQKNLVDCLNYLDHTPHRCRILLL